MGDHILKSTDLKLAGWRLRVSREEDDGELEVVEEVVHPEQIDNPEARHTATRKRIILTLDEAGWLRDALDKEVGHG